MAIPPAQKFLSGQDLRSQLPRKDLRQNHKQQLYSVNELDLVKTEGTRLFFKTSFKMNRAGEFKYAFRMFPKNEDLPHRQDFCFVRWF